MKTHIAIIAWLNIALSLPFLFVGGLCVLGLGIAGLASFHPLSFLGFAGLGVGLGLFFLLFAIPGLILGVGLLKYAPWARIFGIVVSILNLFSLHTLGVGTALGIYSLIILFNPETVRLFEQWY